MVGLTWSNRLWCALCRDYQTGRLTEEERQRKLAEMQGNANQHEAARMDRLRAAQSAEAAEDAAAAAAGARGPGPAGAHGAMKEVFGAMGAGANTSLEARISSRKHYQDRY
jgi:hypothetical protein